MKHTYKVEHNGQTYTRTTEREYTHVVISKYETNWCGNLNLAKKQQARTNGEIVEIPKLSRKINVSGSKMNECSKCKFCEVAGSLKESGYYVICSGNCI